MPQTLTQYDRVRGFSTSQDQRYTLIYGCIDGKWVDSGYFCFHGGATFGDREGNIVVDLTGQDDVLAARFSQDMKHVITKGCDRLWTFSPDLPIQKCWGASTRYYDLKGYLEGIQLDRDKKIFDLGRW
jgi:hypothetical protein